MKNQTSKSRRRARFKLLNVFVDLAARSLRATDTAVWLVLFRDARPNGVARTSIGWIATRIGLDARTVQRSLRRLEDHGIVKRLRTGGQGRGVSAWKLVPPKEAD